MKELEREVVGPRGQAHEYMSSRDCSVAMTLPKLIMRRAEMVEAQFASQQAKENRL